MRVIAGRWRGRRLQGPPGKEVRPTTDRAKEALFNILGPQVVDRVVLDLCCGAGGLGIEALSRGAREAIFVDSAPAALAATRANLTTCGALTESFRVENGEVVTWLRRWSGTDGVPWVLLCDPPYPSATAGAIIGQVDAGCLPAGLCFAAVEHGKCTPGLAGLESAWQIRRYGESHLAIFRPVAEAPEWEK